MEENRDRFADYIKQQKELLDLELEEELRRAPRATQAALELSEDPLTLSKLEENLGLAKRAGFAIGDLSFVDQSKSYGDHVIVHLSFKGSLISSSAIKKGVSVVLRSQTEPVDAIKANEPELMKGVLMGVSDKKVSLILDNRMDNLGDGALYLIVKVQDTVTHRRYMAAIEQLEKAAFDREHPCFPLLSVVFHGAEPQFLKPTAFSKKQKKILKSLNDVQRQAVYHAMHSKDIALIHGPPGTGKTHTIVALILAEVKRGSRVLAVAPSNVAADGIIERLSQSEHQVRYVRVGHPARIMESMLKFSVDAKAEETPLGIRALSLREEMEALDGRSIRDRQRRKTLKKKDQ